MDTIVAIVELARLLLQVVATTTTITAQLSKCG